MSTPVSPAPATVIRVAAGTTAGAAVRDAGLPSRGEPQAVVVVRDADGQLRDLSWAPDADTEVTPVAADTDDGRSVLRHSAAHVLAQAVQEIYPKARLGIGPPIRDGFYYDFDVEQPVHPGGPEDAREGDAARSSRRASRSPAGSSPRTRPAPSWPTSRTSSN